MDVRKNITREASGSIRATFIPAHVGEVFNADFLDEETCRRWILGTIYKGQEISCPQCLEPLPEKSLRRFETAERLSCQNCGKFFTATSSTFLQGSHLTFRQVFLLAVLLYFQVPREIIARKVGITAATVRLWQKKFLAIARMQIIEIENE